MRHARTAAAVTAATALAGLVPGLAVAQEVKIEDAVARVVVIVEDRADIGVEIETPAGTPVPVRLERRGRDVILRGDVRDRDLRSCQREGPAGVQPGEGAFVTLRDRGRVALSDAPLIVVRTPREVRVSAEGGVHGAIGRGARSVHLGNAGCGDWTVADVAGELKVALAGSGDVRAGQAGDVDLALAGSGDAVIGTSTRVRVATPGSGGARLGAVTGDAVIAVPGSGDVRLAAVGGDLEANIVGSGSILVAGGRSGRLAANIVGSGDVRHGGEVGRVEVNIVGSGDVAVGRASGEVRRRVLGSGELRIGR
ncbi:MAG TPA: DUF2807 domain-containing protein [Brevundimonas sp.]|uniref:GIN domain-containing protein n=1 Tax=Brevundimonas sp. TaxID=1871086 RepID=UPI002E0F6EF5|nr:DUF2807 domain-containing protein [Brevundimonas sp.]